MAGGAGGRAAAPLAARRAAGLARGGGSRLGQPERGFLSGLGGQRFLYAVRVGWRGGAVAGDRGSAAGRTSDRAGGSRRMLRGAGAMGTTGRGGAAGRAAGGDWF